MWNSGPPLKRVQVGGETLMVEGPKDKIIVYSHMSLILMS